MNIKNYTLSLLLLFFCSAVMSQNFKPFTVRYDQDLKGDILLIGNNTLNRSESGVGPNVPYNGSETNGFVNMQYVDIDSDNSTFCSSSAVLTIPRSIPNLDCFKIRYAGLYWSGILLTNNRTDINKIKFKPPGGGPYVDLTGEIIYDINDPQSVDNTYACYKDVTSLVDGAGNGTYTVANVLSSVGSNGGTGLSAGWSLFVVYEDPLLTSKSITSFDGLSALSTINNIQVTLDIPVSGFRAIPVGPVRAKFAFMTLEGDQSIERDFLRINGNNQFDTNRVSNNFFNSSITPSGTRVPNSSNLLGWDSGILTVPNPLNGTINNNATNATVTLGTLGDVYVHFFNAFSIEIIEPDIVLTKTVENTAGQDIGNQEVKLCQDMVYVINFENKGNDDAINFTIRDVLPINVTFDPTVNLSLPPGVTYTYTAATRTLLFTIPNSLVEEKDPIQEIRITVKTVCNCLDLDDACSNEIKNQAFATYTGLDSGIQITNDPSFSSFNVCNLGEPGPTNFLVDLDDCDFKRDVVICGNNVVLTAANGYSSYEWFFNGTPMNLTTQSITVNQAGVYTVNDNINTSPCKSIVETINVVDINGTPPLTNPVIPFANFIETCPDDGEKLPFIILCGLNDTKVISTTITGAQSMVWEKLDVASCPPEIRPDCPNRGSSCTWTSVGTGANYTATEAGQFRIVINFPGGCTRTFYFNVSKNLLDPKVETRDIICATKGRITITGVPSGYEYQLNCAGAWLPNNNVFDNLAVGVYSVCIRQPGIANGCNFTITGIPIRERAFSVKETITQPVCPTDKGSISLSALDVLPQYNFTILQGTTIVATSGPIPDSSYTFLNLNPGNYTYEVKTDDGCLTTKQFTINDSNFSASVALTRPLACGNGELTIYPVGGTPTYIYTVIDPNGNISQSSPLNNVIIVTIPGDYTIQVVDRNNCKIDLSINVPAMPTPTFTISQTNVLCYGQSSGEININVSNANGYTLSYSIDNGVTYSSNSVFSNLLAGVYPVIIRYTVGTAICYTAVQNITITQPLLALTASAGVSELAGCGPNGEGKIRIVNPQGGTPGYTYSFDGGLTYNTANEAYLLPGTYNVCIKDSNNCVTCMSVTINPLPSAPSITIETPVYNCTGTANNTVTVSGNYNFTYLLDGIPNTPPTNNVFQNVACGAHTIRVEYSRADIPTFSNLLLENFGEGPDTTSPGINPAYCFERQISDPAIWCNGDPYLNDNDYTVTKAIVNNHPTWFPYRDHTSNGTNPNGRFLAVNIGSAAGNYGVLYSKTINNVLPNQPVLIDIYLANLLRVGVPEADPDFILELTTPSGIVVASSPTGVIDNTVNAWQLKSLSLDPGNNTTLIFNLRSGSILYQGNDAGIDDINIYQLPKICSEYEDFPISIDCTKAFKAQITSANDLTCNGANNGSITISAENFAASGYQISIDGGLTWSIPITTSPYTITGLAAGNYNVRIRYDSNPNNATCAFTFNQIINQPDPLVVTLNVVQPSCLTGAIITTTATGGNGIYQYQLVNSGGGIVVPYQNSNVFSNVAVGTYTVVVRDSNLCSGTSSQVIIVGAVAPTATVSNVSDFCYDTTNGASITVTATGGTGSYVYHIRNLPSGVFNSNGNNNVFNNLLPGSYQITVTDSNGCVATLPTQVIAPQLTLNAVFVKDLDCSTSPNAVINVTILGGYPGYTYQVNNSGSPIPVTGNAFTFNTATANNYQFQITDSKGCTVQSQVFTVTPLVAVSATHTVVNNKCFGDRSGRVTITPSGGTGIYQINFNNTVYNQTFTITGLAAGTYPYTVRDSKQCIYNGSVIITQPTQIQFTVVVNPIQCNAPPATGYSLGSICVQGVSGGTPGYTYTLVDLIGGNADVIFNTATGANHCFPNLDFGIYDVIIKDANGCTVVRSNLIMSNPPGGLTFTINPLGGTCAAGSNVSVTVNGSIGTGPYQFAILTALPITSSNNIFVSPSNPPYTHQFTGLTPGAEFTVVVRDTATGCYYFEPMTAPSATSSLITLNPLVANPVPCKDGDNGSVTFTINGANAGTTSVTYSIHYASNNLPVGNTSATNGTINPPFNIPITIGTLAPGTYNVLLIENGGPISGCGITSPDFTINESLTELVLTATTNNDNCKTNAGVIIPVANGGTGPYLFQYVPTTTTPAAWNTITSLVNPFFGEAGTYDVYVRDAYGCVKMITVTIGLDPTPSINASIVNQCATQGNFSVLVALSNPGIAPYTISVDGGAFETKILPYTYTGLSSGSHVFVINDANGCGNSTTVNILNPLNVSAVFSTLPICNDSNGVITASASGGSASANYQFILIRTSPNPVTVGPQSSNVFTGFPPGNYTIRVTDTTTGCIAENTLNLNVPVTPITFNAVPTSVSCQGALDGIITINLSSVNNDPPYTYQITAPIAVGPQSSNVFTGLAAGTYTVQVNSGTGCINTNNNVVIGIPPAINIPPPTINQFSCNAGTNDVNLATITVNGVTGGSGVYSVYQFLLNGTILQSGTSNTYSTSQISGGTYTINVIDNKGCTGTINAVINPFVAINGPTIVVNNPISCAANQQITVSVTSTGGTASNLSYSVVGFPPNTYNQTNNTGVFNGLGVGSYTVTVLNQNTNCSVSTIHYVNDPNTFILTINNIVNVVCHGGNSGSANLTIVDEQLTPTNDAGAFNYTIINSTSGTTVASGTSSSAGPFTVTGLAAGTYVANVTLINNPFCSVSRNFTISQPAQPLTIQRTVTPVTCALNDGIISVTASGGWNSSYLYQIGTNPYSSIPVFTGLVAGTYTISVKDALGCIASITVTLTNPTPIAATVVAARPTLSCFGDTTRIIISNITGGQGSNYRYFIKGPNNFTPISGSFPISGTGPAVINGVVAGAYKVQIVDGWSCSTEYDVNINAATEIIATLANGTPLSCTQPARLTLSATGGTGPYTYSATGVPGTFTSPTFNPSILVPVQAGTYQFYVQDSKGCISQVSNDVVVQPLIPLTANITSTNVLCNGDNSGTITAIASGGITLNYVYTITTSTGGAVPGVVQSSPGEFTRLGPGIYTVTVTSDDCIYDEDITIGDVTLLEVSATPSPVKCYGQTTGSINLIISGGTGTIQYEITDVLNNQISYTIGPASTNPSSPLNHDILNLAAGTYTINVHDSNGCFILLQNIAVGGPQTALTVTDTPIKQDVVCFGDQTGTIIVSGGTLSTQPIIGGTPPYTIAIYPSGSTPPATFVSLNNGSGGTSPNTHLFQNLAAANYTIAVKDANGCLEFRNVEIKPGANFAPDFKTICIDNNRKYSVNLNSTPPNQTATYSLNGGPYLPNNTFEVGPNGLIVGQANTVSVNLAGCIKSVAINAVDLIKLFVEDGGLNEIVATSQGGSGGNVYTFNGYDNGSNVYLITESGVFVVRVTDKAGCYDELSVAKDFVPIVIPNIFTPNGDGTNDGWSPENTSSYPNIVTLVYDRYGRLIATLPQGKKWDGTYNNQELPSGDYWYVVKVDGNEGQEYVGHFTLYR